MTAAQQRSRDLNRRLETSDRRFVILVSASALLTTIALILIFFQILQVNTRLESQIKENRQATEQAVEDIKAENKRVQEIHTNFLKCILLLHIDERTEATINGCIESSKSSVPSNSTTFSATPTVINPTISEESVTPPPKAPEQPQPSSPVPTAPPPAGFTPTLNPQRTLDEINTGALKEIKLQ